MPAYIGITDREGSGVFDPISNLNISYDFYAINKNFKIDIDNLIVKLESGDFKSVLIIHYFGFLHCDIELIKKKCKENDVILIEDCAHSFASKYKDKFLGSYGDFAFHSIHKFLPTRDGGILKVNNENFKISSITGITERISLDTLVQFSKSDINEICKIRIRNYNYLINRIKNINGIEILFHKLTDGIVPMNLPIIVKGNKREKLYFKLIDEGIPTIALYYRLIDAIKKNEYPDSYYLSNNILNLPVHQDIKKKDIDKIANKIRYTINNI